MLILVVALAFKIWDYLGSEYEVCLMRHDTMYSALYWLNEEPTASILKEEVNDFGILDAEDEGITFLQNADSSFTSGLRCDIQADLNLQQYCCQSSFFILSC